jgi:hypothetical protein
MILHPPFHRRRALSASIFALVSRIREGLFHGPLPLPERKIPVTHTDKETKELQILLMAEEVFANEIRNVRWKGTVPMVIMAGNKLFYLAREATVISSPRPPLHR